MFRPSELHTMTYDKCSKCCNSSHSFRETADCSLKPVGAWVKVKPRILYRVVLTELLHFFGQTSKLNSVWTWVTQFKGSALTSFSIPVEVGGGGAAESSHFVQGWLLLHLKFQLPLFYLLPNSVWSRPGIAAHNNASRKVSSVYDRGTVGIICCVVWLQCLKQNLMTRKRREKPSKLFNHRIDRTWTRLMSVGRRLESAVRIWFSIIWIWFASR